MALDIEPLGIGQSKIQSASRLGPKTTEATASLDIQLDKGSSSDEGLRENPFFEKSQAERTASPKANELKADLGTAASATYSSLVDKSRVLKSVIQSGEYKKILDNEFVRTSLSWFRVSDVRLRVPIYIGWTWLFYFVFMAFTGASAGGFGGLVSGMFSSIPLGIVMGLYVYALGVASGPLNWVLKKVGEWPWAWIFTFPFFTLPWYAFGWPAEKLYSLFFYKYTCLSMGILYIQRQEYDKALAELEKAKVSKNDTDANFMRYASLGDAYSELTRYDEAIDAYRNALQCDPEDAGAMVDLAFCHAIKGEYDEALKIFRGILATNPENTTAYLGISRCYIEMDMFNEAIGYLQQAIALEPQSAAGHKMFAEAYVGLGDDDAALKEARLALSLNPLPQVAEGAQEIIDYVTGEPGPDTPEAPPTYQQDNTYEKPLWCDPASGAQHDDGIFDMPTETGADLHCVNPLCNREIPSDSVFCGYCGTMVTRS
ncbi:MAG: tetratricopeptide repeat protein [Spirochaetaceae bacterium]|nr:tetratricopeptide repeat protein [Spirochaetaceae bacterium]